MGRAGFAVGCELRTLGEVGEVTEDVSRKKREVCRQRWKRHQKQNLDIPKLLHHHQKIESHAT